jgi:hypothetical protein
VSRGRLWSDFSRDQRSRGGTPIDLRDIEIRHFEPLGSLVIVAIASGSRRLTAMLVRRLPWHHFPAAEIPKKPEQLAWHLGNAQGCPGSLPGFHFEWLAATLVACFLPTQFITCRYRRRYGSWL